MILCNDIQQLSLFLFAVVHSDIEPIIGFRTGDRDCLATRNVRGSALGTYPVLDPHALINDFLVLATRFRPIMCDMFVFMCPNSRLGVTGDLGGGLEGNSGVIRTVLILSVFAGLALAVFLLGLQLIQPILKIAYPVLKIFYFIIKNRGLSAFLLFLILVALFFKTGNGVLNIGFGTRTASVGAGR